MRMEQYLQCIDYTLWEIVENGNAPIVTKTVDGKETVIPNTSVEEKAQRRAWLKARSTLLLQPEAYESEDKGTSSSTTNSHNVAFCISTSLTIELEQLLLPRRQPSIPPLDNEDLHKSILLISEEIDLSGTCYADYKGKKILKEYWKEVGHDKQRKNWCDGFGYDWSDQAEEGPTNFALMAYSLTSSSSSTNSEVSNDSNCCSSCLECVKDLKEQNEQLVKDLRTARISDVSYKTGLESVEARLQIMDKCKIGLGYNVVPPPYTGNFMPPKSDLVYPSLDDFVDVNESVSESVVEKPTVETNEPKTARKENGAPIIKDWVSERKEEDEPKFQTVKPNFTKIEFVKPKTDRKPVEQIRQDTYSPSRSPSRSPRGNKRNWNQQMSQKLGSDFDMFNKACYVCGSFDHLKNDCNNWYNNGRFAKPV
ncbi:hypothetical protein Tco_1503726 [Tanacetum coccineum]